MYCDFANAFLSDSISSHPQNEHMVPSLEPMSHEGKEAVFPETEFCFLSVKIVNLNTVINRNVELFVATR